MVIKRFIHNNTIIVGAYGDDADTGAACGTHPTTEEFDWTIVSCDGVGCGIDRCVVPYWFDKPYPSPAYYNQGWPWEGESMSSDAESAKPVTGEALASCGSCGASRFAALVRLGEYWLATP